jgi:hypothetical protein
MRQRIRFQADADVNPGIGRGLLRREPSIDFRPAGGVIPDGTPDPEVSRIAAEDERVLVSADLGTMSVHFRSFIATHQSPGLLLIPRSRSIGAAIEGSIRVWLTLTPEDLRNQFRWLP